MSDPALRLLTEEAYLRSEEFIPVRREYVDGFVYAQAGASLAHLRISSNVQRIFLNATKSGPCWSYASDLKIRLLGVDRVRYYSPDVVVVCESDGRGEGVETRPCLIVEILSPSTRQIGLSFEAKDDLSLPSLQGYLLIDSEGQGAELYRRLATGSWTQETMQDALTLPCLDTVLTLHDIYEGVELPGEP